METQSTGSMWEKSNSIYAPSYTGPVNRPEQRRATTTVLPTQTTGQSEMMTDITATVTMETALQNASIFSVNSGNCINHFPISMFQTYSGETEQELVPEDCELNSHCQGLELELCCANGSFSKCVRFQSQVGIDYYLGWVKLKINEFELDTNYSGWDYFDLLRNASSWLEAALLTHDVSDANIHVLCPEATFIDQQYPVLGFMLAVDRSYSIDWLQQGFHILINTSEYVCDVKLGDGIRQMGNTSGIQGHSIVSCNLIHEARSSNASSMTTESIWNASDLENISVENSTALFGKSMETRSTGSMWEKSNSTDAPSYTGPVNRPEQRRATTTVLPTQTTGQSEMMTDITATVTMETAFIAFRASISIINWNFTEDLNNNTSTAYRNMEELFVTELSQLLSEAAEVTLQRALNFTVLVERFRKGSIIIDFILLTHIEENVTLANMTTVLLTAVNHSLMSESGFSLSYGNIEDFDLCDNDTCAYYCEALVGISQCTCANGLNGHRLTCIHNASAACGAAQAEIPNRLMWELQKMSQFLDFANATGCSLSRNLSDMFGILQVKDLCQGTTNAIKDLWLDWENEDTLHLYLEGPNITVCQFSVSSEDQMLYKIIDGTDGIRGSFLVDYACLNNEQSFAFGKNESLNATMIQQRRSFTVHENESLNVTVSIESGLVRDPRLFIKNCHVESSTHEPEGDKLIENGCSKSKGVSIYQNGNASLVLLSVDTSVAKNSTYLKCELQICAENQCACTNRPGKRNMGISETFKENSIEIGPITILKNTKKDKKEPSILTVILITVGTILLVILLLGLLRYVYRYIAGSSFSIKSSKNIFRRQSSMNPVTLKSWKHV
ncbi:uncharacterized protein LOC122555580 [Chiloscyllium plagiosum]|uniref:uncharacterized protein LOC122555580 n=1 Tax=Chiloscyllium plagiosum TaxID=36176 RepID=UPI001CB80FD2|nr:uncharacterized protein LOC122555580 [Chiloscyllium plagiosum]